MPHEPCVPTTQLHNLQLTLNKHYQAEPQTDTDMEELDELVELTVIEDRQEAA